MKNVDGLIKELENLYYMDKYYKEYIEKLRAEQLLIKNFIKTMETWKSGKAKEAFSESLTNYFSDFSILLLDMDSISIDIKKAIETIQSDITTEISKLTTI